MTSRNFSPASTGTQSWRTLYKAALNEIDREKLPTRITEAESALISRGQELLLAHDNSEEAQAVDRAIQALRAIRNCLNLGRDSK